MNEKAYDAAEFLGGAGVIVGFFVVLLTGFGLVGCVFTVVCGLTHISKDFV